MDQQEYDVAKYAADQTTLQVSSTNISNEKVASTQAQAVMYQALQQYLAQLDTNRTEYKIQHEAILARLEEIKSNERMHKLDAANDEIKAQSMLNSAAAQQTKADASLVKAEASADKTRADIDDDDENNYDYLYTV